MVCLIMKNKEIKIEKGQFIFGFYFELKIKLERNSEQRIETENKCVVVHLFESMTLVNFTWHYTMLGHESTSFWWATFDCIHDVGLMFITHAQHIDFNVIATHPDNHTHKSATNKSIQSQYT